MADRYRLTELLGGKEFDGVAVGKFVHLDIPGHGTQRFDADLVTLVIPREPIDGTWMVLCAGEPPLNVFSRNDAAALAQGAGSANWWHHDKQMWLTWLGIYNLGPLRRLHSDQGQYRTGRAICPVCEQERPLKADGTMRHHGGGGGNHCRGSNKLPSEVTE